MLPDFIIHSDESEAADAESAPCRCRQVTVPARRKDVAKTYRFGADVFSAFQKIQWPYVDVVFLRGAGARNPLVMRLTPIVFLQTGHSGKSALFVKNTMGGKVAKTPKSGAVGFSGIKKN